MKLEKREKWKSSKQKKLDERFIRLDLILPKDCKFCQLTSALKKGIRYERGLVKSANPKHVWSSLRQSTNPIFFYQNKKVDQCAKLPNSKKVIIFAIILLEDKFPVQRLKLTNTNVFRGAHTEQMEKNKKAREKRRNKNLKGEFSQSIKHQELKAQGHYRSRKLFWQNWDKVKLHTYLKNVDFSYPSCQFLDNPVHFPSVPPNSPSYSSSYTRLNFGRAFQN